ncbi:MAG: YhbY family RNA-binding protein [Bifidobacteriaceae bacterium]|jgi:RNA-binding protein|nr:YhbY family RNA-binding protein [Bifidobacteriaceae bacterium]
MALSKKQIKQLKTMAIHINPLVTIGRNDITDTLTQQASETLDQRELLKVAVQDGSSLSAKEAGTDLAERLSAELVQVIGNRFVLYRKTSRDDVESIKLVRA